jgi:hypothetical protein
MKGLAYALVALMLFFPAAASEDPEPETQAEGPCSFFAYSLTPPDYRIDEDCPPLSLPGP